MKYTLANYILSVESNDPEVRSIFGAISVGGEGNHLNSITINIANDLWQTESYATGAWVHSKNLARNGTCDISLSQVSTSTAKFIKLCNIYYGGDYDGFTLTLTNNEGEKIATLVDCYITKIPAQVFEETSANQTWQFTCGEITIN